MAEYLKCAEYQELKNTMLNALRTHLLCDINMLVVAYAIDSQSFTKFRDMYNALPSNMCTGISINVGIESMQYVVDDMGYTLAICTKDVFLAYGVYEEETPLEIWKIAENWNHKLLWDLMLGKQNIPLMKTIEKCFRLYPSREKTPALVHNELQHALLAKWESNDVKLSSKPSWVVKNE